MVFLKKISNRVIWVSVSLLSLGSCEEKIFVDGIDCDDCYYDKPSETSIRISLSERDSNNELMVILYKEYFDIHNIQDTFHTTETELEIWIDINKDYAVAAHYQKDNKTIIAIDEARSEIKKVSSACGEPCWVIETTPVDLTLKY